MSQNPVRLIVLMGVCGCGKSSIGTSLADRLSGTYIEGDELHPAKNIELMSAGVPLTDEDRWPWLEAIAHKMALHSGLIFTGCSALRKSYRSFMTEKAGEPILFVHLDGTKETIASRMENRTGHFMPAKMLESQLATLEPPDPSECSFSVDIAGTQKDLVNEIIDKLRSSSLIAEAVVKTES